LVLYLEFAHPSPLSHSLDVRRNLSLPSVLLLRLILCLPAEAVVMIIHGLLSVPHPMPFVAFAGLSLIPSLHRLVACLVVFGYLANALAPMLVYRRRRSRCNLGILGVSLRIIRALPCYWNLGMRCAGDGGWCSAAAESSVFDVAGGILRRQLLKYPWPVLRCDG